MATQAIAGYNALLYISDDGGTTYSKIGELRDVTINVNLDAIEATSHDSGGWREFLPGLSQWGASAEALYVDADAGQDKVFSALDGKSTVKFRFTPKTGTGLEKFEGDGIITSWELSGPNDDAAAVSIEIQGTGALSKSTQ